jgi:hypothetical protein
MHNIKALTLHGGGQGFESPRLHSDNLLICRLNVERAEGHYSRVKLLAAVRQQ